MNFFRTCLLILGALTAVMSAMAQSEETLWEGVTAEGWRKMAVSNQIPTNQLPPLLQHILRFETNDDLARSSAWCDVAERLHTNGQFPPYLWRQYLIDSVGVQITVADNATRREGLPFWFIHPGERANLDGLNITLRGWLEDDLSGIPIHGSASALYPISYEKLNRRGVNGSGFGNREELSNSAFASLRPGLQTYHYRYHIELFERQVPLDTADAPVASRVIDGTLPWRLLPENAAPPLPTLQTNAGLRDALEKSLRCGCLLRDTKDTTLVEVSVQADQPPTDSAFDVAIRVGDRTWPLGPVAWMKGKMEGWWFQTDLPEDIQSVDLVFIPSAKAGARLKAEDPFRTTRLEKICSGPSIVLTNIAVQNQEISMIRIEPPTLRVARDDALDQFDASDPVIQQLNDDSDWPKA